MNIRRLQRWLLEVWHWLSEGKIVFMCLFVIVAAVVFGFFTWRSESSIRIAGYFLQFIGMVFAIRGLLRVRTHFGQTLLRIIFVDWLKRFPKWKQNVVVGVGSASCALNAHAPRIEIWAPDNTENSIEQRVAHIVQNLERVRVEIRQHADLIDKLEYKHEKHKKEVADQNKRIAHEIRADLEILHTSDLITSLVGLVWLAFGITMSTISQEIYLFIK